MRPAPLRTPTPPHPPCPPPPQVKDAVVRAPANMEEAREVAEWREARRKAWPTAANVARKVGGGAGKGRSAGRAQGARGGAPAEQLVLGNTQGCGMFNHCMLQETQHLGNLSGPPPPHALHQGDDSARIEAAGGLDPATAARRRALSEVLAQQRAMGLAKAAGTADLDLGAGSQGGRWARAVRVAC